MAIEVRDAIASDMQAILDIINYEILHSTSVYDYDIRTLDQQQEWFSRKQENNMPVIVAVKDDSIIAYGTYGIFRPWDGYRFSVEHSVYTSKNARGMGAGKVIMNALIERAKAEGYKTMIAGIDSSNSSSIVFHEKHGFVECGMIKSAGFKFNKWLDLTFMQLLLHDD